MQDALATALPGETIVDAIPIKKRYTWISFPLIILFVFGLPEIGIELPLWITWPASLLLGAMVVRIRFLALTPEGIVAVEPHRWTKRPPTTVSRTSWSEVRDVSVSRFLIVDFYLQVKTEGTSTNYEVKRRWRYDVERLVAAGRKLTGDPEEAVAHEANPVQPT